ncbi:MAG: sensor histidine kinase, partial [Oscillospiraceae bacterium]|nr:sensor histidine kinase [Oscillospiraceae bacterium]
VKNISEHPLNVEPSELTERFKRGDSARSDEGSGLGLSIAQSFVQAQGGRFALSIDGDLFKASVYLPK